MTTGDRNSFNKEEKVAFDRILENFNDALVMSSVVNQFNYGNVDAERAQDTIWRPMPYISKTYRGIDQTARFAAGIDVVQRSVPSTLTDIIGAGFQMSALELRDAQQADRIEKADVTQIASDINTEVLDIASNWGSIVVARPNAASGYNDVAEAETSMTEVGIKRMNRYFFASPRDNQAMAADLAKRQTINNAKDKPTQAYENSHVGRVANFDYMEMDYANILPAAQGGAVTVNGADQRHVPIAIDQTQAGQINVDNRSQLLVLSANANVVPGDAFTIAGVNSVHHITKRDTGQRKTFRILEVLPGNLVRIVPAIVAVDHATPTYGEEQYQNVTATPANGAAIIWLNTAASHINPFLCKDSMELITGVIPPSPGGTLAQMTGTTDQGVSVLMTRDGVFGDLSTQYRCDCFIGVTALNPEMMGIEIFNQ